MSVNSVTIFEKNKDFVMVSQQVENIPKDNFEITCRYAWGLKINFSKFAINSSQIKK